MKMSLWVIVSDAVVEHYWWLPFDMAVLDEVVSVRLIIRGW